MVDCEKGVRGCRVRMWFKERVSDVLWTDYEDGVGEWKASRKKWEDGVGEIRVRAKYEHGV
jgi:hypothetical protein